MDQNRERKASVADVKSTLVEQGKGVFLKCHCMAEHYKSVSIKEVTNGFDSRAERENSGEPVFSCVEGQAHCLYLS